MNRVYLDHNATTPIDPKVLDAVWKELEEVGNPSSSHFHGQRSRQRLENARERIARFFKAKPHEIIFTSGGTEGAQLLLKGILERGSLKHVITSDAEHSCVHQTIQDFQTKGCQISFLSSGSWGAVRVEDVEAALQSDTGLMVFMAVNNETGVKTDIEAIASLAEKRNIPFIVDGVALLGKEDFSIPKGVSAMFFSGHKLHAPKGIGVVFCRKPLKLVPQLIGGGQEFGRRAGTENLPGIIGMAAAVDILSEGQKDFSKHMQTLRDRLEKGLIDELDGLIINGQGPRTVNTTNISFSGVDGESLLMALDMEGISISHGSACSSGSLEPSRILLSMGIPLEQARSAIRFSLSRFTTQEEIDRCIASTVSIVRRLRSMTKKLT